MEIKKSTKKSKIEIRKNVEKCAKMIRNGSRKMIQGSQDHGMDENCAPNPLEGLPEARNPFKDKQMPRTLII